MKTELKIIGIGQMMRGDDAVGLWVVDAWAEKYHLTATYPLISVDYQPLPGLALLDQISGCQQVILVDAVLDGPEVVPGVSLQLGAGDLACFNRGTGSAHGWGVAESLRLAETLGRKDMPEKLIILGIGGKQVELGEDLSPEVAASVPAAVEALNQLVEDWLETQFAMLAFH